MAPLATRQPRCRFAELARIPASSRLPTFPPVRTPSTARWGDIRWRSSSGFVIEAHRSKVLLLSMKSAGLADHLPDTQKKACHIPHDIVAGPQAFTVLRADRPPKLGHITTFAGVCYLSLNLCL